MENINKVIYCLIIYKLISIYIRKFYVFRMFLGVKVRVNMGLKIIREEDRAGTRRNATRYMFLVIVT